MSLIITKNFKRAKAQDSAAKDANFKVGDTVRVDASYSRNVNNGIGKVVKVDGSSDIVVEFAGHGTVRVPVPYATLVNSRATDSRAMDAKFKVGDRVKHAKVKFPVQPIGKISEVYDDPRWVEVEWENTPYKYQTIETSNLLPANSSASAADSRAADACEDSIEFHVGQKVKHTRFGTIGKVFEIAPDGAIGVQWSNGQAYYGKFHMPLSEIVAVDACGKGEDAAGGAADDAAQDAKFQLAFAVGAIENAIERYSKTFSRYEDNLEEKDFKRYNTIFHAAVNMRRAIQSA